MHSCIWFFFCSSFVILCFVNILSSMTRVYNPIDIIGLIYHGKGNCWSSEILYLYVCFSFCFTFTDVSKKSGEYSETKKKLEDNETYSQVCLQYSIYDTTLNKNIFFRFKDVFSYIRIRHTVWAILSSQWKKRKGHYMFYKKRSEIFLFLAKNCMFLVPKVSCLVSYFS